MFLYEEVASFCVRIVYWKRNEKICLWWVLIILNFRSIGEEISYSTEVIEKVNQTLMPKHLPLVVGQLVKLSVSWLVGQFTNVFVA